MKHGDVPLGHPESRGRLLLQKGEAAVVLAELPGDHGAHDAASDNDHIVWACANRSRRRIWDRRHSRP